MLDLETKPSSHLFCFSLIQEEDDNHDDNDNDLNFALLPGLCSIDLCYNFNINIYFFFSHNFLINSKEALILLVSEPV